MAEDRQRGALADLREIPWGTPDAEALARLLAPVADRDRIAAIAAGGKLRTLIDDASVASDDSTARALLALAERPQAVRHVFRGELDWTDPDVWEVHRALVEAFGDASEDLARLAAIHAEPIDDDRPPAERWTALMRQAAREGRLEALIEVALADAAMADLGARIEEIAERPWRAEGAARESAVGAPRRESEEREKREKREKRRGRRVRRSRAPVYGSLLGLIVGLGLIAAVGGYARHRLAVGAASDVPAVAISGSIALPGASGALVLTRDGVPVQRVTAGETFAFDGAPLDEDRDGQIDERWQVRLERTSAPCPALPLPLDRARPDGQRWEVPTARVERGGACRVSVSGLAGLAPGDVIELDAGVVEPRRFAIVERVSGGRAEAAAAGEWSGCEACWPRRAGCADIVALLGVADPEARRRIDAACFPGSPP